MRSCRTIACIAALLVSLLWAPSVHAREYAVLISAGVATADDAKINSEFWYDLVLQYTTLLDEGYGHDDIFVLYGHGSDFSSAKECYQLPYPVTDQAVSRANIQGLFTWLSSVMTENDFLYVWWMGHGDAVGGHLQMWIDTTMEVVQDDEFAAWVGQITDYDTRAFSIMTCFSGGILDDLEGPRSIVMSSATFYETSDSGWLCDSYHAEFHYYESTAFHWQTPCGECGPVDADDNDNGRVSFTEAFAYTAANVVYSTPLLSDQGGSAPDKYLTALCGNGDIESFEECDDGGTAPGDGCDETCQIEPGWVCSGEPSVCSFCGDGLVEGSEGCDDGGTAPGDGCDASCQIELGWDCVGQPSVCSENCGDGTIVGSEGCDDGDTDPGDGCDETCQIEPGWVCSGEPSVCSFCGDGLVEGSEGCDDGGTAPGDGCDASCQIELGWDCVGQPSVCSENCGDGTIVGSEGCDDGDTDPGDGCDEACQIESGWVCSGEPSVCSVSIDWVTVGDPGNACDSQSQGCFGAVAYAYQIGKYEVTNAQYTQFLNAVAHIDTNGLYNTKMGSGFAGGVTRSGSPGSYTYGAIAGREEMPVNYVSFYDALRFANWLHNGQPTGAQDNTTTEDGAYDMSLGVSVVRKAGAKVFLPSEDEWYKAAYYDGSSTRYFDYPTGSDIQTTCATPGATSNTANCDMVVADLTDVGSYTGSASPSITFDQGGNLWEWNEAVIGGSDRCTRGGAFNFGPDYFAAWYRNIADASYEGFGIGIRVASPAAAPRVPSLSSFGVALLCSILGFAGLLRLRA